MPKIAGERHPKVIRRKTDADTFQRVSKSNYKQVVGSQLEDTFLSFPEMYFFYFNLYSGNELSCKDWISCSA